jgi:hypothetical protein
MEDNHVWRFLGEMIEGLGQGGVWLICMRVATVKDFEIQVV